MINVALVRGKYLNNFEGQNFIFDKKKINLVGISSLFPIHNKFPFSIIKLPSLADLGFNFFLEKGIKWFSNRILGDSQILFGLAQYIKNFDLVDSADPHYYYSYQLAKLKERGLVKKLIITYCETIPFNNEGTKKKKFIKYFTMKHGDLFIVHTKKSKEALIKEKIDEKLIKIIRLGVDLDRFKPIKKKEEKNKEFKILFVGRIVKEKGIFDLYEIYKEVLKRKKTLNLKLLLVGEGDLKRDLINLIKKEKLENFITLASSSYNEINSFYQKADLLVVPSKSTKTWEEQYGMVLIEGMASGLPIVAYNSGAISEVLDGGGVLVKDERKDLLFKNIIKLIEDNKKRVKLSFLARKRAENYFDAKKTAKNFEEVYYKILKERWK